MLRLHRSHGASLALRPAPRTTHSRFICHACHPHSRTSQTSVRETHRRYYGYLALERPSPLTLIAPSFLEQRRTFLSFIPSYFIPPTVFIGLVLTLWIYKCFMMILFQNKIIYMPSVPPFSRKHTIEEYLKVCASVKWRQEMIRSLDGTKLALCIGRHEGSLMKAYDHASSEHVVIVYFQGNASSIPPRLPSLSTVLETLHSDTYPLDCTIVALSYRGFWKSSGRASQRGIEQDAIAATKYAQDLLKELGGGKLVFWGQSIGAGVATTTLANMAKGKFAQRPILQIPVNALILETPFTSIQTMLVSLYPQRWLPYRYMWPFLWNWWDSDAALRLFRGSAKQLPILCVTAEKDEVVPPHHGKELMQLCTTLGFQVSHQEVKGALHTEAMARQQGRMAVVDFLRRLEGSASKSKR